jgi:hypothetical protein
MITSLRPLDEALLVHIRPDCGATDSVALYSLWRRRHLNGSSARPIGAGPPMARARSVLGR